LLSCYDGDVALGLLGKSEDQVLAWFCAFENPSKSKDAREAAVRRFRSVAVTTVSEYDSEIHFMSLLRHLLIFSGRNSDIWQRRTHSAYTANDNANAYGSVVDVQGSNSFGGLCSQELIDALLKSPLFNDITTPEYIKQLSIAMLATLHIGFPEGFLV
jgi:hypothetical protein